MRSAHFQVARDKNGWLVRFENRDYRQRSRRQAIHAATELARKIGGVALDVAVMIQPTSGERWREWRPGDSRPAAGQRAGNLRLPSRDRHPVHA